MKLPFRQSQHVSTDLLSTYLDNQVTAVEQARIEAHVRDCETCRSELDSLRQTVALLHALPRVPVPHAFTLSEAQVGIRKPAGRPGWYGGAFRGLAAVTAVALIVIIAARLLRQPVTTWTPSDTVARVAPQPAAPAPVATSPSAVEAPKALTAEETMPEATVQPQRQAVRQAAPAVTGAAEKKAAITSAQPTQAPAQPEAASPPTASAREGPAPAEAQAMARAEPLQATSTAAPASRTDDKTMAAMTSPTQPAAPGVAMSEAAASGAAMPAGATPGVTMPGGAMPGMAKPAPAAPEVTKPGVTVSGITASGLGRGGGPNGLGGLRSAAVTPEPAPASVPVSTALPTSVGLVYADQQGLWALDSESGAREVAQAPEVNSPLISDDRAWIAYRIQSPDHSELWAVRWNGKDARLVLNEANMPKDDLASAKGYGERHIRNVSWIPGQHRLAITMIASPAQADLMPEYELWNADLDTGTLKRILNMGQADRPFYGPNGKRFAVLEYQMGANPEGNLRLFNADGTSGRIAFRFAVRPDTPRYDSQVNWLPDGSGLWLAVPDATADSTHPLRGIALYRVPVEGETKQAGHIEAIETFWSPDGTRLAYTRPITESLDLRELFLANADGSGAQPYAASRNGAFLGWSPEGRHFLYQDGQEIYLGGPGQSPQRLGNVLSVFQPRWITPDQLSYLQDQGTAWMLVSWRLDGKPASLVPLPPGITYDVTPR